MENGSGLKKFPLFACAVGLAIVTCLSSRARAAAEIGVGFGPFLPSRINGVTEVMNGLAVRAGLLTSNGFFEGELYSAHGDGADYNTLSFDFRLDLGKDLIPEIQVFALLGLNRDFYKPSTSDDSRQGGGLHYGGGVLIPIGSIASPVQMRFDFKHRFGAGNSLIALLGFSLAFGNSTVGDGAGKR